MNEFYVEQLVPRKTVVIKDAMIKYSCIILTIVAIVFSFLFPIFWLVMIALAAIDVYLIKNSSVEYEYLYLNGELEIDKIIAKQKRKNVYSVNIEEILILAHLDSAEVIPFQQLKTRDFSSGDKGTSVYKMIILKNGQREAILIEPNENLLCGIKVLAAQKVFD